MSEHKSHEHEHEHEHETVTTDGHEFTFYSSSGGVVITRGPVVVDAGIIGTPGPITRDRLYEYARHWMAYRRDFWTQRAVMRTFLGNQPTNRPANYQGEL